MQQSSVIRSFERVVRIVAWHACDRTNDHFPHCCHHQQHRCDREHFKKKRERDSEYDIVICPSHRMGRVDVVARMVIELVNTRHTNVVCACFRGLVMSGHGDALAQVAFTVAEMDRPDVIATVSPKHYIF